MAVTSAILGSPIPRSQSASINHIASQWEGSILDGGVPVQSALTLTSGYTQKTSRCSANIPAQSSTKVSAGQSAKFSAGLSGEDLSCPNSDISNRGKITPFKGFMAVTARGEIDCCQSINDRRVEFCESIKKGSISATRFVQPFGSIPRLRNSARPSSFNQLLVLVFSSCASSSNCFRSSLGIRIGSIGDLPPPFGCLSLDIDMHMPIGLLLMLIGIYIITYVSDKTTPRSARNTSEASNHNVNWSNTMAMYKSTQTHPKFKWRFFSCQQTRYFTVTATSEAEARSRLPDSPCLFSARIRQEVRHA